MISLLLFQTNINYHSKPFVSFFSLTWILLKPDIGDMKGEMAEMGRGFCLWVEDQNRKGNKEVFINIFLKAIRNLTTLYWPRIMYSIFKCMLIYNVYSLNEVTNFPHKSHRLFNKDLSTKHEKPLFKWLVRRDQESLRAI